MTQQDHHEGALLERDTEETIVVFRKWKEDGSIIALFPGLNHESGDANMGHVMSYAHCGQHREADYEHCIRMSVPALEHEYEDLAEELTSIGYNLRIIARKPLNL